jgi:uncharacterized protein (TIGR00369 family)
MMNEKNQGGDVMKEKKRTLPAISGLDLIRGIINGDFPAPSMAKTIPMMIESAEPGTVRFSATAGKEHINPLGGVHGGFAATVLDSVTGCAVQTELEPGADYATVDLNVKMLKPVPIGKTLSAIGKVIQISRSIGVAEGTLTDETGKIYAHATATCMIRRP